MIIEAKELSKIYGEGENQVVALDRASLTIAPGDFISIMGPSGSGKSTLLHLLSGLDRPTSGQLTYDGSLPPPAHRLYFPAVPPAARFDRLGKYCYAAAAGQKAAG